MGKPKRKFTDAVKRAAVDDYISGRKSAAQLAAANEVNVDQIYKWKIQLEEKAKGVDLNELEATVGSREGAKLLAEMRAERDAYQRMVGEQAVIGGDNLEPYHLHRFGADIRTTNNAFDAARHS